MYKYIHVLIIKWVFSDRTKAKSILEELHLHLERQAAEAGGARRVRHQIRFIPHLRVSSIYRKKTSTMFNHRQTDAVHMGMDVDVDDRSKILRHLVHQSQRN